MDENTPGKARGISVYDFFPNDGRLQFLAFVKASNPSYVLTDRSRQIIYAVHEHASGEGAGVSAFKVSRKKDGKVNFIAMGNVELSGSDPCHLSFAGRNLVTTCYTSGQIFIIPLDKEGRVEEIGQSMSFTSDTTRKSHAHCAAYQEAKKRLLVTDLGADRIRILQEQPDGSFVHTSEFDVEFPEMEGPRHIAMHPEGRYAVVNGECKGVVRLLDISGEQPTIVHQANALPERVVDQAHGAAIRFGKSGKMVYVTDRNFSVVNALKLDQRAGSILFRHTTPSGGEHPRDMILSPDGQWLLTANTVSSSVGVFRVDPRGELTHYHTFQKVPTPTAFAWL